MSLTVLHAPHPPSSRGRPTTTTTATTSGKLAVSRDVVSRQWSFLTQQNNNNNNTTTSSSRTGTAPNNTNNQNLLASPSSARNRNSMMISSSSLRLSTAQSNQVVSRLLLTGQSRRNGTAESHSISSSSLGHKNQQPFQPASWFSNFDENVEKIKKSSTAKSDKTEQDEAVGFTSIPFSDFGDEEKKKVLHVMKSSSGDEIRPTTTSSSGSMMMNFENENDKSTHLQNQQNRSRGVAHHFTVLQPMNFEDEDVKTLATPKVLTATTTPLENHHSQTKKKNKKLEDSDDRVAEKEISLTSATPFASTSSFTTNFVDDDEKRSPSPESNQKPSSSIVMSTTKNPTTTTTTRSSRKAQREKRIAQIQEKFDERQYHFVHGICSGVAISSAGLGGAWLAPNPVKDGPRPEPIPIDLESVSMAGEMLIPKISESQKKQHENLHGKWKDLGVDDVEQEKEAHHASGGRFAHMPVPNLRVKVPYRPTNSHHLSSGAGGSTASASSASPFTTSLRKSVQKYMFVDEDENNSSIKNSSVLLGGESSSSPLTSPTLSGTQRKPSFSSSSSTAIVLPSSIIQKQQQEQQAPSASDKKLGKSLKAMSLKLVKFKDQLEQKEEEEENQKQQQHEEGKTEMKVEIHTAESSPSSPLASTLTPKTNNNLDSSSTPSSPSASSSSLGHKVFGSSSSSKKMCATTEISSSSSSPKDANTLGVGPKSIGWKKLRNLASVGLTKDLKSSQSPTRPTKDRSNVGIGKGMSDFDRKMELAEQRIHGESVAEIARRKLHAHVQKFVSILEDIRDECGFESGTPECAKLEQVGEALRIRHISYLYESLHDDGKELISPLSELDAATSDPELLRALRHGKTMKNEESNWRTALGGAYGGTAHISSNTTAWSALPGINRNYHQTNNNEKSRSSIFPDVTMIKDDESGADNSSLLPAPKKSNKKREAEKNDSAVDNNDSDDDDDSNARSEISSSESSSSEDADGIRKDVRKLRIETEERIQRDNKNILLNHDQHSSPTRSNSISIPPIVVTNLFSSSTQQKEKNEKDYHQFDQIENGDKTTKIMDHHSSSGTLIPASTSVFSDERKSTIELVRPRKLLFVESQQLVDRSIQSGTDIEEPEVMCRLAEMHMKALGAAPSSTMKRKSARVLI